jgi:cobalt/nickel transport system permease protein
MLASTLFIRSWEQGEKLYIAMDSRCYDGKLTVFDTKRPIRAPEAVLASVYAILAIALSHFTGDVGVI